MSEHAIKVVVNGVRHHGRVPSRKLLVHYLRDDLRLTSVHVGCDSTQCGACTVHVDGHAVKSCTVLAVQADGSTLAPSRAWQPMGSCILSSRRSRTAMRCSVASARPA